MRWPIVLKTPELSEAPAKLYYEVASNGLFQVRETSTHRAVTRATAGVPGLLEETERVDLLFPRLPASLLEDILAFFDEVYRRYRGEAIVVLFYNPETGEHRAGAPPQRISGYLDYRGKWWPDHRLQYDLAERPEGFVRFGTIHSHASLPAYSSLADCDDERFEDGLHAVYGGFASEGLSRSACFVANGRRFRLEPDEVLEPCAVPEREAPPHWMEQVECTGGLS